MADEGLQEIAEMVAVATKRYEFRRRKKGETLVRTPPDGELELLVDGSWIETRQPRGFEDPDVWKRMTRKGLRLHARRYLIGDLAAPGIGWQGRVPIRFRCTRFWRWLMPPLGGGTVRRELDQGAIDRSLGAFSEPLKRALSDDLVLLREEALLGYEHQRERCAGIEQRANFFLGAAGLTTSLVLANAGVLLGAGKLHSPWLQLAAVALGVASLCAIAAGFRAMQATMSTFGRTPPNSAVKVSKRSQLSSDEMSRSYVAAHFLGGYRESAIGDWKIARLAAARRWFLGSIAGVVLLTGFVLIEAL